MFGIETVTPFWSHEGFGQNFGRLYEIPKREENQNFDYLLNTKYENLPFFQTIEYEIHT